MNGITRFFLICSGANLSILKRTPTEINKYVGIGATIFFTGVFAAIAAGYALSTLFDNYFLIVPIALLWGVMIFNLDRFIVSTMKKKGSFWKDFASATPRLVLACLIAIVIAKPLELKIFETEIQAELVKMEQEQFKIQDDLVNARYTASIDSLESDITLLKSEVDQKKEERDLLVNEAIKEADGTGGSMQRNLGPIYKTKKAAADNVQVELDELEATNLALIQDKRDQIKELDVANAADKDALDRVALSGFAARMEGLERASDRSSAIYWATIFITLLFLAIETAPVFTKLILGRSPYDYYLDQHEHRFAMNHMQATSRLESAITNEARFDRETIRAKTKIAIESEAELAQEAFKRKVEELKGRTDVTRGVLKDGIVFGG